MAAALNNIDAEAMRAEIAALRTALLQKNATIAENEAVIAGLKKDKRILASIYLGTLDTNPSKVQHFCEHFGHDDVTDGFTTEGLVKGLVISDVIPGAENFDAAIDGDPASGGVAVLPNVADAAADVAGHPAGDAASDAGDGVAVHANNVARRRRQRAPQVRISNRERRRHRLVLRNIINDQNSPFRVARHLGVSALDVLRWRELEANADVNDAE